MKLMQLPRCVFGHHNRDRRRAYRVGDTLRSNCTGCGKPMVRQAGGWRVTDAS